MKNLKLNTKHVLFKRDELLKLQSDVSRIHNDLMTRNVAERDWLGWFDLPYNYNKDELKSMKKIADKWANDKVELVVVIGIGGSYLGAKSGYDFIYGPYSPKKPLMELMFAGNDISSEALIAKLNYVADKKFAINVISKSGTTLEPSIAFREFRKLLEQKLGLEANKYIVATTDAKKGVLFDLATAKGYQKFVVPDDIGGRFSVLSSVGLFPFYCAGIDAQKVLEGAKVMCDELADDSILKNPAYEYATTRYVLHTQYNYSVEMMVAYEPKLQYFCEWWKQLFAESEGKNGKGIWPASGIFSTDLHSLGQMVQEGSKILFETILTLQEPLYNITFKADKLDLDKLGYLDNNNLHNVNNVAFEATLKAHTEEGKVPNILLQLRKFDEETLGSLFMFFERALAMSAYLLGVNPFNQPGVEVYKKNMFSMLGKK
ncbi:glucose-6-phosphate isomerase [Mycoplasmopsis alligatoris]|uniref:Glucose-6-phosphate isomerase n=1 Tax=Mycoplasmopsis alligatoris A21JP2 TaxID=747682 RepID=D4XVS7_9BACT|nr:glucose-6-phosphate isomerase [Mycoplasmopsis alligatoris]EFF41547.1 glucose-6-phosphate isomerase [Mycoplasmopsis alligatoris A21JP2]